MKKKSDFSIGKLKDLINIKNKEVVISLILSFVTSIVLLYFLNIYSNWSRYELMLQSLTLYIFQSFIGLIGIIVAGVAVVISVFTKDVLKVMRKFNLARNLVPIFKSFVFLANCTAYGVFIFLIVYFSLYSETKIDIWLFSFITFLISYIFYFIIFYTVSLIGNIVRIFFISSKSSELFDETEEFIIDKSLSIIQKELTNKNMSPNELLLKILSDPEIDDEVKRQITIILLK
ncbi:hypothetical protein [Exiguobacterium sp. UBA4551]|uniref:hypothetical protein n=1 Tax=Exiguobacterium sp. UBA4551 TaxID=1946494 RepID=UPI00257CEF6A|nr:hypothetical protein [Exiguobacterium sp. UBA4551]